MSLFNGSDIFLSSNNPSKVTIGPAQSRNINTPIPGIDGAFSQTLGWQPRRIVVSGILAHTSIANLKTQITTITSFIDHLTYVFVDNFGATFNYVKMEGFQYGAVPGGQNSQITQRGTNDYITQYRCLMIQVSPGAAQA